MRSVLGSLGGFGQSPEDGSIWRNRHHPERNGAFARKRHDNSPRKNPIIPSAEFASTGRDAANEEPSPRIKQAVEERCGSFSQP